MIGIARALGQLQVAHTRVGMRLDGRACVWLGAVAAHEHLDVGPGAVEHRGEGHRQQRRDVAPDGDAHRDQRLAVERRCRGGLVAPAVEARARRVNDVLGPGRVLDDLLGALESDGCR